jgi:hypothetical protein
MISTKRDSKSYKVAANFYESLMNTMKAAIKSMIDVIGPHKILSGLDGVIQFKVVLNA